MQGLTLIVALAASVLIICLSPMYALLVYIASISWYPTYLTLPVGTIDFTLARIVILILCAKLLLSANLTKKFRFIWLDGIVIMFFAAQLFAGVLNNSELGAFLENWSGGVFDTFLPYFAVRMVISDRQQYVTLLKGILVIMAVPAVLGFYQCITGNNLLGFFRKYFVWQSLAKNWTSEPRWGLSRADVVFPHPIMYGLFFAMLGSICAGVLPYVRKPGVLSWIGIILACIGVFSSMSSGPWLAALIAASFMLFYPWRRYWKPVLATIVLMCMAVEIISNRHFYDVLADFSFSSGNAWYRSKLIDVALFEGGMTGHWLVGFPHGVDPGWGPKIDGLPYTDMVNHYLLILYGCGLVGFIPFLAMNVLVVFNLIKAFKASVSKSDKWLIWCLSASFCGLWGAFMSVSLYSPSITVYYMMIGFAGVMPAIIAKQGHHLQTTAGATTSNRGRPVLVRAVPTFANSGRLRALRKHNNNT